MANWSPSNFFGTSRGTSLIADGNLTQKFFLAGVLYKKLIHSLRGLRI